MRVNGYLLTAWFLLGCGGASAKAPAPVTANDYVEEAPERLESRYKKESEAAMDDMAGSAGGMFLEVPKNDVTPQSDQPLSTIPQDKPVPKTATGTKQASNKSSSTTPDEPMVIYTGYLQLRVKQLLTAVDEITQIVDERGGYIDSLTQTVVVVRIPGNDFEAAMTALAAVGDLLNRRVQAQDVTQHFTDLITRRNVAMEARERLLELLETEEESQERLRILKEIKRLSEQIDTIESTLSAIRNLVDYFTITIELVPILAVDRVDTGLSPFDWVRELKPHIETLYEGKDDISISLPRGFVLFDEDESYRAQAADTTIIRAAKVENEPKGDNPFWVDAIDFEMTSRQEKIKEKGDAGPITYRLYENDDVSPRFYLVAVNVTENDIFIIEVFYPNADAYERHHKSVIQALETVEVAQ